MIVVSDSSPLNILIRIHHIEWRRFCVIWIAAACALTEEYQS